MAVPCEDHMRTETSSRQQRLFCRSRSEERCGISGDLLGPKQSRGWIAGLFSCGWLFNGQGGSCAFLSWNMLTLHSFYSWLIPRPLLLCNVSKAHVQVLLKFRFLVPLRRFGRALALCANELEYCTRTKITQGCFDPINYKGTVYTLAQF